MVYLNSAQYRSEAITFAKAEISKRGIKLTDLDATHISAQAVHPLIVGLQKWRRKLLTFVQARSFEIGVSLGLVLFFLANGYSYYQMKWNTLCFDCFLSFGVPFHWYSSGGYFGTTIIHWWQVLGNSTVAIALCLVCGALTKNLLERLFQWNRA